jgi:hypothetical protein
MNAIELIRAKRVHLARLANQSGAAGESTVLASSASWVPRPKGVPLRLLLSELRDGGIEIKPSSFDAIAAAEQVDFLSAESIRANLHKMIFIEIKTANQPRVRPGFNGFFFALTESEIAAADQLGDRHKVALFNRVTDELLITSIPEILKRSRSVTWQVSVQL